MKGRLALYGAVACYVLNGYREESVLQKGRHILYCPLVFLMLVGVVTQGHPSGEIYVTLMHFMAHKIKGHQPL